ncbi:MAG: tRNA (adenosine(37)-N6)-threonylcarbamoyltransferase complex ATPase subunit type 1 TsaE [Candidatus Eisenbacteria bacterium]
MSVPLVLRSAGEPDTLAIAGRLAEALGPGDVVALTGELGAGKTRFVEGACRALGYSGRVRSPSYTLLNIYRGRMAIHHLDLYRWSRERREAETEEWRELLDGEGVSFIEWAEHLGLDLPARAIHVHIVHEGDTRRRLEVHAPGERLAQLRLHIGNGEVK